MRDDEVIAAAADAGLALVFTGKALGRRRPLMTQSGHSFATKQRPCPDGEGCVQDCECQKQMREHAGNRQRHEHSRNKYQSVDNTG